MSSITSSPIFECAIGIVLLWFLVASLCSLVVELVASAFGFRANQLWRSLSRLLGPADGSPGIAAADGARLAKKVQSVGGVMDKFIASIPGVTADSISRVKNVSGAVAAQALVATRKQGEAAFDSTQLGRLVSNLPTDVTQDEAKLRDWLERWYDGTMASVSASYRKNIRWWTALAGLVIAGSFGLDSIAVVQQLYRSPTERAVVVAQAGSVTATGSSAAGCTGKTFDDRLNCAQKAAKNIASLNVSLWNTPKNQRNAAWLILLGILATWAAAAAGAPFWFDILKRMSGLRSPPATTGSS